MVQKDATCSGGNWARELQPLSPWATAREATAMRSPQTTTESSPHSPQLGKSLQSNEDRAAAAKALQLCLILCDPVDGSPPGSPVPGIL